MRVVVILLVCLVPRVAWPCKPVRDADGSYGCSKWKRIDKQVAAPEVYVRDERAALPTREGKVRRHLVSSTWHRRGVDEHLELFAEEPSLVRVGTRYRVYVDGAEYRITRCKDHGKKRTCLERTT